MGKILAHVLCLVVVSSLGVTMSAKSSTLKTYKTKRDFTKTPEPKNNTTQKKSTHTFVIQQHWASHKHFDLRLRIGNVLKSWAVPKDISTDPTEKHLAIPTEDHPLSYASFEGVIPPGNYGAGTVMVWDTGSYTNIKKKDGKLVPMSQCYKDGRIEVSLDGKKLQGRYALIKTKSYAKDAWLLLKMNDEYAHKAIKNKTKSALSGRTMKQIAAQEKPSANSCVTDCPKPS